MNSASLCSLHAGPVRYPYSSRFLAHIDCLKIPALDCTLSLTQSTYKGRVETRGSVSALSAGAYTTTLYILVDIVKGGCACISYPHQLGLICPSWWNVRQKVAVAILCTLRSLIYIFTQIVIRGTYTEETDCTQVDRATTAPPDDQSHSI
jgi:hypothetical protein